MQKIHKKKKLSDCYKFQGFHVEETIKGVFGDHNAKVITLKRNKKKQSVVNAARYISHGMIEKSAGYAIYLAVIAEYILRLKYGVLIAGAVVK